MINQERSRQVFQGDLLGWLSSRSKASPPSPIAAGAAGARHCRERHAGSTTGMPATVVVPARDRYCTAALLTIDATARDRGLDRRAADHHRSGSEQTEAVLPWRHDRDARLREAPITQSRVMRTLGLATRRRQLRRRALIVAAVGPVATPASPTSAVHRRNMMRHHAIAHRHGITTLPCSCKS